jgi:hypothetical protein
MTHCDKVKDTFARNTLKRNCVDVLLRYIINEICVLCFPTFYIGSLRLKTTAELCESPPPPVVVDSNSVGRWEGESATPSGS